MDANAAEGGGNRQLHQGTGSATGAISLTDNDPLEKVLAGGGVQGEPGLGGEVLLKGIKCCRRSRRAGGEEGINTPLQGVPPGWLNSYSHLEQ